MIATDLRLLWLRRVLFLKVLITILVWGLPALLGPLPLLATLKIPIPADPIYLRLFGGAATAWGVAYWFAYKDPVRNAAIVKAGLIDNALPTLAIVYLGITSGISSAFIWISGLLTSLFFVSFLLLMPREENY
ncbi:MAG: hypothetical protein H5T64_12180 [Chloroflexi bacterium]|nr:hypothetical protein [Chloroflexota bacterium]